MSDQPEPTPPDDDGVAEEDLDDLIKPESFVTLSIQAREAVRPRSRWYIGAEIGAFLVAAISAGASSALTADIARIVRDSADKMFSFGGAVLGMIVAAFAILATVAMSDAVVPLAVREDNEKYLAIKKIALLFIAAFVPYVLFAAWYGVVVLVGWQGGPATAFTLACPKAGRWFACAFLGVNAFALTRMLIVLGALITNVYTTFMLLARARIEKDGTIKPSARAEDQPAAVAPPMHELPGPGPAATAAPASTIANKATRR